MEVKILDSWPRQECWDPGQYYEAEANILAWSQCLGQKFETKILVARMRPNIWDQDWDQILETETEHKILICLVLRNITVIPQVLRIPLVNLFLHSHIILFNFIVIITCYFIWPILCGTSTSTVMYHFTLSCYATVPCAFSTLDSVVWASGRASDL